MLSTTYIVLIVIGVLIGVTGITLLVLWQTGVLFTKADEAAVTTPSPSPVEETPPVCNTTTFKIVASKGGFMIGDIYLGIYLANYKTHSALFRTNSLVDQQVLGSDTGFNTVDFITFDKDTEAVSVTNYSLVPGTGMIYNRGPAAIIGEHEVVFIAITYREDGLVPITSETKVIKRNVVSGTETSSVTRSGWSARAVFYMLSSNEVVILWQNTTTLEVHIHAPDNLTTAKKTSTISTTVIVDRGAMWNEQSIFMVDTLTGGYVQIEKSTADGSWVKKQEVTTTSVGFGYGISYRRDGLRLAIGSPAVNSAHGEVRLFTRAATDGEFTHQTTVSLSAEQITTYTSAYYHSVSLLGTTVGYVRDDVYAGGQAFLSKIDVNGVLTQFNTDPGDWRHLASVYYLTRNIMVSYLTGDIRYEGDTPGNGPRVTNKLTPLTNIYTICGG